MCDSIYFFKNYRTRYLFTNHHKHDEVINDWWILYCTFIKMKKNCKYVLKLLNLKALEFKVRMHFDESIEITTNVIEKAQKYKLQ